MTDMLPTDRRQLRSELHSQDVAWRMSYPVVWTGLAVGGLITAVVR
jgi:hypothetical protein